MSSQVCQICGEVGVFYGQLHAMATHHLVDGRYEYVDACTPRVQCASILRAQPFRFCELCRKQIENASSQDYRHGMWCCCDCIPKVESAGGKAAVALARGYDPSAAGAFVREARNEWYANQPDNALHFYDKAIAVYRVLTRLDADRWNRGRLEQAERERKAIDLWMLNQNQTEATP